jgi:predicted nuclease of predicted toxin-antitoxin system
MNILADESVDQPIVERLRADGHDVLAVVEMAPGLPDEDVLTLANQRGAVLLTADTDFGELVFRQHRLATGVVLIRLAGLSVAKGGSGLRSHPGACERTGRSIHRGEP